MKEEVIIKILGKVMLEQPEVDHLKLRGILEEVLYDYDVQTTCQALVPVNDIPSRVMLFIASKKLDGLAQSTLNGYVLHLKRFARFMNKNLSDISTMDIRMYLAAYSKTGVKASTISTEISILKSFFTWLENEDYINKSPMRKIKQTKKEKRIVKALNIEELEQLREACVDIRERALLEVLYATGCRLSEVVGLNRSDIDWQNMSARVIGKGNKERIVYFSHKAFFHLRKYLMSRQDENEALFVTERRPHNRLGNRAIQRDIKEIAARTSITKNVHPHVLRHTFATLKLENGARLSDIQALLGHSDPSTTQTYAQTSEHSMHEAYLKYHAQ